MYNLFKSAIFVFTYYTLSNTLGNNSSISSHYFIINSQAIFGEDSFNGSLMIFSCVLY